MSEALSNYPAHIELFCSLSELGTLVGAVTPAPGGFHHWMWRMETENGCFAVKHLAGAMDRGNAAIVRQINATEFVEIFNLLVSAAAFFAYFTRVARYINAMSTKAALKISTTAPIASQFIF